MNTQRGFRILLTAILVAASLSSLFFVSGCAVNPATKEREFMLVSENQEFQMGQEVDKQVREQMGVYAELPNLRSLVKETGERIGQVSDRPQLIYRIEIVDATDFNAFALPGGFVYVHRGLLERVNSTDELASILGHEIAHVAARHSAAQMSKAQLLNIGVLGAAIATGGAIQNYGDLINLGAALTFNKFSRDAEREADHFGTQYMIEAGYNPEASLTVMRQIQSLQDAEPSTLETWFMTHPPTAERVENLTGEIEVVRSEQPEVLKRVMQRNSFIALLDGMAVGEWNGTELVQGDRYYNKEHLVSIPVPEEWQVQINSKGSTALFGHVKKQLYAGFDIEPLQQRITTEEYYKKMDEYLRRNSLRRARRESPAPAFPHGALSGLYYGGTGGKSFFVEGIAFVKDANGYSFIGQCKEADCNQLQPQLESMMQGFQFITASEAARLEPGRMRIHTTAAGDTWDSIARKYFTSGTGAIKLAQYNGLDPTQPPPAGALVKIPPTMHFR